MYKYLIIISLFVPVATMAQTQTDTGSVVVYKDARIDQLIHKQMEINEETTRDSRRSMPGYRIQVISSTDRNKVFASKTKVYQQYPDLKQYLLYQPPNYKLRVGNFRTQEEAEDYEKQLSKLFPSGLYVIRDTIEVIPEKFKEEGQQ
jgi:hypothetical protein